MNILFFLLAFQTAPAVFQTLVNDVLNEMVNQFIYVYLDDILIFSHSLQEYVQHVRQVLQRLLENGLYVKAEKCVFHAQSVHFLGYIVSAEGGAHGYRQSSGCGELANPRFPQGPAEVSGLCQFLLAVYLQFQQLATPLTALTSTKTLRLRLPN